MIRRSCYRPTKVYSVDDSSNDSIGDIIDNIVC